MVGAKRMGKNKKRRGLVVGVTVGGSAFSLLNGQLAWYQRQGWNVTLVCSPDQSAELAVERENVSFFGIPMQRGLSPLKDLVSLFKWIRSLYVIKPQALNVGTPKAALLGITAGWITRVPKRVYVVRGLRLESASGPLGFILWCMERLTSLLATDVVFVSESLAIAAKNRKLLPIQKSWVIGSGSSNGVDAKKVIQRVESVDRIQLRKELGIKQNQIVIGYIGRINRDKGIDVLIQALKSSSLNRQVFCIAIGAPEDVGLAEQLSQQPERARLLPKSNDVWKFLAVMDILCLPTLREGFPNVVLEASAAGIPVITTTATGAVDSVIPGVTGVLTQPGNVNSLVDAINELASNESLRIQMGSAARERVIEDFQPDKIWAGMQEILIDEKKLKYARKLKHENTVL